MVGGLQSARSVVHLSEVFALANDARLLPDPDAAAASSAACSTVAGAVR